MQGGLHWFEDRKEKQFMFENYYSDNIPRRTRFVKRQEFILTLKYVINKWELLQKPLHFVIKKGIIYYDMVSW